MKHAVNISQIIFFAVVDAVHGKHLSGSMLRHSLDIRNSRAGSEVFKTRCKVGLMSSFSTYNFDRMQHTNMCVECATN